MVQSVLVVDDDVNICRFVGAVLEECGMSVRHAPNGAEALTLIGEHAPDVILLDLEMPVMNGWTFAAELLTRDVDVPLVIMSGSGTAHSAAEKLGAVGYLSKPFDEDQVLRVLGEPSLELY